MGCYAGWESEARDGIPSWKRCCRGDGGTGRDTEKRRVVLDSTGTQMFEVVGTVTRVLH